MTVLVALTLCLAQTPADHDRDSPKAEACRAQGGDWERRGCKAEYYACVLPDDRPTDVGRKCRKAADCQSGACVAQTAEARAGTCASRRPCGCNYLLNGGKPVRECRD